MKTWKLSDGDWEDLQRALATFKASSSEILEDWYPELKGQDWTISKPGVISIKENESFLSLAEWARTPEGQAFMDQGESPDVRAELKRHNLAKNSKRRPRYACPHCGGTTFGPEGGPCGHCVRGYIEW